VRHDHPFAVLLLGALIAFVGALLASGLEDPIWGLLVVGLGGIALMVGTIALGVQIGLQYYDDTRY
jgi:hypothetical protein